MVRPAAAPACRSRARWLTASSLTDSHGAVAPFAHVRAVCSWLASDRVGPRLSRVRKFQMRTASTAASVRLETTRAIHRRVAHTEHLAEGFEHARHRTRQREWAPALVHVAE